MSDDETKYVAARIRSALTSAIHAGQTQYDLLRGSKAQIDLIIVETIRLARSDYTVLAKREEN